MQIKRGEMYSFGPGSKRLVIANTSGEKGDCTVELGEPPVVEEFKLQGKQVERIGLKGRSGFVKDTGGTILDVSVD